MFHIFGLHNWYSDGFTINIVNGGDQFFLEDEFGRLVMEYNSFGKELLAI